MNQKGFTIVELLLAIIVIGVIFFGAFKLWESGEKSNLQACKERYGSEYTLGHSNANSSIEWCESPDGIMKTL